MVLPYWSSEIYVDITSWFPFGSDYSPVSVNKFFDTRLEMIARGCMELDSEFLFMVSPLTGCVGNLSRDNLFKPMNDGMLTLGFMMLLGYSDAIEQLLCATMYAVDDEQGLNIGIAPCSFWREGILTGHSKVIAIVSREPFYDHEKFLTALEFLFSEMLKRVRSGMSFYAEKFGYTRFYYEHENFDPLKFRISQALAELKTNEARNVTGASPEINFPPFLGMVMGGFM